MICRSLMRYLQCSQIYFKWSFSQHFNIKIYSFVFWVLAPKIRISAATKTLGLVCFGKVTLLTVVKCSLSTQGCLSKVNLYMFMQGTSSSCMLHHSECMATAGILLMTCITLKERPFQDFVNMKDEYEGCLCASVKGYD